MEIIKDSLTINSKSRFHIIDITGIVNKKIKDSKINCGIINIFSKHSTSAIVINENESGLGVDIENKLYDLIPPNQDYSHDVIDNNCDSHLKSFFLGSSETVPIKDCRLDLGTWQSVFFIELDGPRSKREVNLTIIGQK